MLRLLAQLGAVVGLIGATLCAGVLVLAGSSSTRPPLPAVAAAPVADSALREQADPVASYTLRASLDPVRHVVEGEGTIVWKNASTKPQRELWVHLYLNAFESDKTLFGRTPAAGFRGAGLGQRGGIEVRQFDVAGMGELWPANATSPGDPDDRTDIRVPLPREVLPGESLTITMRWRSELPSIVLRTGFSGSFHMVGQWFPKLARLNPNGEWAHFPFHPFSEFYSDFGTYDVRIEAPEAFTIGATGKLVRATTERGRTTHHYHQDDVHDFAFTAWDKFEERSEEVDGVTVRCLFPPGYERAARVEIDAARFGLSHFGEAYGRYPYNTLTIVHPPDDAGEAGGMEYPTLITTGGPWYLPWTGVHALELVTLHELGHQWFYGLVATNEHKYPFLDEGINSYAEVEAMDALFPGASAASTFGLRLGLGAFYRVAAVGAATHGKIARSAPAFKRGSDLGALVYARSEALLDTVAGTYGRDRLHRAIGNYTRGYRFEHPGPDELFATVEETLGADAERVLRQGFFDGTSLDYAVEGFDSAPDPAGGWSGSASLRRRGSLVIPVEVDLHAADGTVTRVRVDGSAVETTILYGGGSRLVAVVVDPEHRLLLDERLDNNAKSIEAHRVAPRVLDLLSFAGAALLSLR